LKNELQLKNDSFDDLQATLDQTLSNEQELNKKLVIKEAEAIQIEQRDKTELIKMTAELSRLRL